MSQRQDKATTDDNETKLSWEFYILFQQHASVGSLGKISNDKLLTGLVYVQDHFTPNHSSFTQPVLLQVVYYRPMCSRVSQSISKRIKVLTASLNHHDSACRQVCDLLYL